MERALTKAKNELSARSLIPLPKGMACHVASEDDVIRAALESPFPAPAGTLNSPTLTENKSETMKYLTAFLYLLGLSFAQNSFIGRSGQVSFEPLVIEFL